MSAVTDATGRTQVRAGEETRMQETLPRAIVVDDSRTARALLRRALTREGIEVTEAGDGQQALDALARTGPLALALVDWNMPVLGGYDLNRALRARHECDGMRIMVVTSESETAQVERALSAGANEHMMKPFPEAALREKLLLLGLLR